MGEINYTPFSEEDPFNETALSDRFSQLGQQGIDDLTQTAFQKGCLVEPHFPSFLSYSETVEFGTDANLSVSYESDWDVAGSVQTGLTYWNASTSSTPIMNYPPNDGAWGPIQNGAGGNLVATLPASVDFTQNFNGRYGISAVLVMLNVQIERVEVYDPANQDAPIAPSDEPGVAVCIQVSNDNTNWYHLYLGDSEYTNGSATGNPPYRYRLTERRVEATGIESENTGQINFNRNMPSRRDLSIRTLINQSSIANTVNAQNAKGALGSFRYIRGAVSIIKYGSDYNKKVVARIRKANLTIMCLRANEVNP